MIPNDMSPQQGDFTLATLKTGLTDLVYSGNNLHIDKGAVVALAPLKTAVS